MFTYFYIVHCSPTHVRVYETYSHTHRQLRGLPSSGPRALESMDEPVTESRFRHHCVQKKTC